MHTPGPWIAERNHDGDWVISQPGNDGQVVCCLRGCDGPEWEANARLIAAAPDLLAACNSALAGFAGVEAGMGAPGMLADCASVTQLKAAIAKAEGGVA